MNPLQEQRIRLWNADKVAQMMLKKGQIFPFFPGFLADEKFTTRLGAMVAVEEIARQNPVLASLIVLPLWERFERAGSSVKEGIVYVLGVSGNDQTVPMLESVLNDHCSNELKESAVETIERIHAKNLLL